MKFENLNAASYSADLEDGSGWIAVRVEPEGVVVDLHKNGLDGRVPRICITPEALAQMVVDYNAPDPDEVRDDQKTEAAIVTP